MRIPARLRQGGFVFKTCIESNSRRSTRKCHIAKSRTSNHVFSPHCSHEARTEIDGDEYSATRSFANLHHLSGLPNFGRGGTESRSYLYSVKSIPGLLLGA